MEYAPLIVCNGYILMDFIMIWMKKKKNYLYLKLVKENMVYNGYNYLVLLLFDGEKEKLIIFEYGE